MLRSITLEARIVGILRRIPIADSRLQIIDIGCGTGGYWKSIISSLKSLESAPKHVTLTLADVVDTSKGTREAIKSKFVDFCDVTFQSVSLNREGSDDQKIRAIKIDKRANYLVIASFDVLEHLEKPSGWLMLYDIDHLAANFENFDSYDGNSILGSKKGRAISIIGVPNGFVYQPPSLDNSHNAHLSEWTYKDLRVAGYSNIQAHSQSKLRLTGPEAKGKLMTALKFTVEMLDGILVLLFPRIGYEIVGLKTQHESEKVRFTGETFA